MLQRGLHDNVGVAVGKRQLWEDGLVREAG